ncbi:MAG: DUF429 domain-containing protein [Fimbriimonadaceae bacterium]|nr:DUF429 domain-containing protein [Fimbriimonadaceae bacterium]
MVHENDWDVLGIDPAPSKEAVIFDGTRWEVVCPQKLRDHIEARLRANPRTLIAWDSPLSFGRDNYYDRLVDKVAQNWVLDNVEARRFEEKAVNALPFAGVPQWAVSCASLGYPFGTPPKGLRLATDATPDMAMSEVPLVIEVHPAVAIGVWWLDRGIAPQLPVYKGRSMRCIEITELLRLDAEAGKDDDHLDACVAYHLGRGFLNGGAQWLGNPVAGGYVLPVGPSLTVLSRSYAQLPPPRRRRSKPLTALGGGNGGQ